MKDLNLIAGIMLAALCFASCKKEGNDSNTRKMLYGTWEADSIAADTNDNLVMDPSEVRNAATVFLMVLNEDGSFALTNTGSGGSQNASGSWSLRNADETLRLAYSTGAAEDLAIESLKGNRLVLADTISGHKGWLILKKF